MKYAYIFLKKKEKHLLNKNLNKKKVSHKREKNGLKFHNRDNSEHKKNTGTSTRTSISTRKTQAKTQAQEQA